MTIAVAVQVHDGVVLASDSALTLTAPDSKDLDNVWNVYNNANKIFNLRKGLPIGGMVYGIGSLGSSSISTLAKDLRRRFSGQDKNFAEWKIDDDTYTLEQVAAKVREFLYDECYLGQNLTTQGVLGFVVAGYSAGAQLSETWIVEIIAGKSPPPRVLMACGVTDVYAGGDIELYSRMIVGHGLRLPDALRAAGLAEEKIADAVKGLRHDLWIPLIDAPMPIQDVIDFAEFVVGTTVSYTRFKRGAAIVGGPTESAAITKHEGFKWARRKHYFDVALNPGDEHERSEARRFSET